MKEILGWILCSIGILFAFKVMIMSGKNRNPDNNGMSYFNQEYDHDKQLSQLPGFKLYVFLGLGCLILGMYLIGFFG